MKMANNKNLTLPYSTTKITNIQLALLKYLEHLENTRVGYFDVAHIKELLILFFKHISQPSVVANVKVSGRNRDYRRTRRIALGNDRTVDRLCETRSVIVDVINQDRNCWAGWNKTDEITVTVNRLSSELNKLLLPMSFHSNVQFPFESAQAGSSYYFLW